MKDKVVCRSAYAKGAQEPLPGPKLLGSSARPKLRGKGASAGVKIDSDLLADVEAFINLDENKFKYVNRKQFIDIAVAEYLRTKRGKK